MFVEGPLMTFLLWPMESSFRVQENGCQYLISGYLTHLGILHALATRSTHTDIQNYIPPLRQKPHHTLFSASPTPPLTPHHSHIEPFLSSLSGKWAGYYCYENTTDPPDQYDGLMTLNISFASPNSSGHPSTKKDGSSAPIVNFVANGVDALDEFSMKGTVARDTGKVYIRKNYIHRHERWLYEGVVLPYGIAGYYSTEDICYGSFWIWKVPPE
ncbi:hypothetical protein HDV00_000546 [Rhizophlyctis rosea]|nr:hypothetical protein HDV00_000546 [Rhizophlyctis rosea]